MTPTRSLMFRAIVALFVLAVPVWGHVCWEALQVRDSDGAMRIARVWVTRQADADRLDGLGYDRTELSEAECVTEPYPPTPPPPQPPPPEPPPQPPRPQPEPQPSKSAPHGPPKFCRMLGDVQQGDIVYLVNPDARLTIDCLLVFENDVLRSPSLVGVLPAKHKNRYPWDVDGDTWGDAWAHARCTGPFWLSLRTPEGGVENSEKCRE